MKIDQKRVILIDVLFGVVDELYRVEGLMNLHQVEFDWKSRHAF